MSETVDALTFTKPDYTTTDLGTPPTLCEPNTEAVAPDGDPLTDGNNNPVGVIPGHFTAWAFDDKPFLKFILGSGVLDHGFHVVALSFTFPDDTTGLFLNVIADLDDLTHHGGQVQLRRADIGDELSTSDILAIVNA